MEHYQLIIAKALQFVVNNCCANVSRFESPMRLSATFFYLARFVNVPASKLHYGEMAS